MQPTGDLSPLGLIAQRLRRTGVQKSDHRHRALLRARRQRPARRRTAEKRDEFAALHSITSSARASMIGGISRPIALAVLTLITSVNLVGRSIGKSAALAPLRMRSTYIAARLYMSGRLGPYAISPPEFGKRVKRLIVGRRAFIAHSTICERRSSMSGDE